MHPAIAIDGPAASGKSTVAKLIADRLGYTFINTGAMYRAVTWYMLEQGINPADTAAVLESLPSVPLSFGKDGSQSVVLCGRTHEPAGQRPCFHHCGHPGSTRPAGGTATGI